MKKTIILQPQDLAALEEAAYRYSQKRNPNFFYSIPIPRSIAIFWLDKMNIESPDTGQVITLKEVLLEFINYTVSEKESSSPRTE